MAHPNELFISEFADSGNARSGAQMQMGTQPAIRIQRIDYSGGVSVQSIAFHENTRFVRLYVSSDCHVDFGVDPSATHNHMFMPAGTIEYFSVRQGDKLAILSEA